MDYHSIFRKFKKGSTPKEITFFKTDYLDSHIKYYRLAIFYIALLFPFTGFVYKLVEKELIDPIGLRIIISGLFFSIYFLSFKIKFVTNHIISFFNLCLFFVFIWAIYIASVNDFSLITSITFILVASINAAAVSNVKYIIYYSILSLLTMILFFFQFKIDPELGYTIIVITFTIQFVIYLILKSKKDSESILIDSEMKMRNLIEVLGEGIIIVDQKDMIQYANPQAHYILNFEASQVTGKSIADFIKKDCLDPFLNRSQLDSKNTLQSFELDVKTSNQESKTLLVTESLYNIKHLDFLGTLMVFRDISELKQKEIELKEAKKKAEESERLKSSFLANMSHEIRTPMNGIIGFTDLMSQTELTYNEQKHYSSIIHQCCHKLLNVINDIIDVSKIEAGMVEVRKDVMDLNDQIQLIYHFFKPEVEAKGMELILKYDLEDSDSTIITDADKFYSILTNLVKNSIKYSHQGYIEFGYKVINKNSKINELQFYVTDTGIGIPIDRQESIFERFIQVDLDNRRSYQGSGLGLSIAKSYVEMLGGTISVESVEGIGSTFYFTIPYQTV